MSNAIPPEQDISPFMKVVAAGMILLAALGGFGVISLLLLSSRSIDKWVVVLVSVLPLALLIGALIIWRPSWMRWVLETIADKLPMFAFEKRTPAAAVTPRDPDHGAEPTP